MRYFTKELWAEAQKTDASGDYEVRWKQAADQYRKQLELIRPRLSKEAFSFFTEADVHDGELLELRVIDGSRPAQLGEPAREWRSNPQFPVRVELKVLDAYDKYVWSLTYTKLRRLLIDYPSTEPLFFSEGEGFGDWGYQELTDANNGFLRHEVLFATGATLLFDFQSIEVSSRPRPGNDTHPPTAADAPKASRR